MSHLFPLQVPLKPFQVLLVSALEKNFICNNFRYYQVKTLDNKISSNPGLLKLF